MIDTDLISQIIGMPIWLLFVYLIWEYIWKGFGMWKAAKKKSPIWFVALLLFNTAGILSILYIYLFSELNMNQNKNQRINTKKSKRKSSRTITKKRKK